MGRNAEHDAEQGALRLVQNKGGASEVTLGGDSQATWVAKKRKSGNMNAGNGGFVVCVVLSEKSGQWKAEKTR